MVADHSEQPLGRSGGPARAENSLLIMATAGNATSAGRTHYRWFICALIFFATTINYIDRQVLSLLKGTLDQEFHWTNEEFGVVNALFQGFYGLGLLGFGWFVDRFGVKVGYAVSIIGWSLSAMGHGLVNSVAGFKIARVCLGLSESGNFPSAIKGAAQWFPKKERALATALFNSGANVGTIVAPATIPFIAAVWGWRGAFVAAGLTGFIWLAAWLICYELPEKHKRVNAAELAWIKSDTDESQATEKIPWIQLLRYRQTWSFFFGKLLTDPVWWFFLIWLPDYFRASRGLDIKHGWIYLSAIYSIVTVLSIAGGWLTGHLNQRGWSVTRARKTGMFLFALCVLPVVYVTNVGIWGAVGLIGLAAAAHQAWSANLYTTVSDMFPKSAVASVIGFGGMAGSAGAMFFPILTGRLLDHFHQAGHVTEGYRILFSICAGAYILAFVVNHLLAPRFEPFDLDLKSAGKG
jgi:ACS family hexuronate transporter-like MFS transporter